MTEYNPDNWVILKVDGPDGMFYRVLAGWSGGYLDGDSWKINSGIVSIDADETCYYFKGYSGSVYKCHKESETLRNNNAYVYNQLKDKFGGKISIIPVEEIDLDEVTVDNKGENND